MFGGVHMENNKSEARKAMDNAVEMITKNDYNVAKHFAAMALRLCPELDGLNQLMMMIDVHLSSKKRIGKGVPDLYGILGIDPFATTEAMKKQFRKLQLALHPDKNRIQGVEAWCKSAFELVVEAWEILSDKNKRLEYNIKCGQGLETKTQVPNFEGVQNVGKDVGSSSNARNLKCPRCNQYHQCLGLYLKQTLFCRYCGHVFLGEETTSHPTSNYRQNVREEHVVSSARAKPTASSFWTKCNCTAYHEYPRIYLNKTLFCRTCRHSFVAKEVPPPSNVGSSRKEPTPAVKHHFQWDSSSRMFGYSNTINATRQAASVVQQAQDKLKGVFEESRERDNDGRFTDSDLRNFKRFKTDDSRMHGPWADKTFSQTGASSFSAPNFVLVDEESQERDDPGRVNNWFQERNNSDLRNFLSSLANTRASRLSTPNDVEEKRSESKKGKGVDLG